MVDERISKEIMMIIEDFHPRPMTNQNHSIYLSLSPWLKDSFVISINVNIKYNGNTIYCSNCKPSKK